MKREQTNDVRIDISGTANEKTKSFRDPPLTYDKVPELKKKGQIYMKMK